jgi:hypothetical protein
MADPSRDVSGLIARPKIEVGTRRADDGAAGVLRHHQAPEFLDRFFTFDRQFRFDEEWRAVDVDVLVGRDRAAGRKRDALRAERFFLWGKTGLAKEHERLVAATKFLALVWIGLHTFADAVHRHFILRHDVAFDQDATDRRIGQPF